VAVNYKKLHGSALIDAGYMLVPIKAGEKYPNKKGWSQIRSTLKDVENWAKSYHYGGLGVLGEFTPGIDIDVYDKEITDKLVVWCQENIGITPIRVGNAPRALLPYAPPPGGLGPDSSAKYEDSLGDQHQIEIKAKGQQWVAYGLHPKTEKPYTWTGGELHDEMSDFLPTLTGAKIKELFEYFESIIPKDWSRVSKGRDRTRVGGVTPDGELQGLEAFANYKPPLNIDADRIRSMLSKFSPDAGHDTWRTIGMALYHQFGGEEEGLELFIEWSQNSVDYNYDEIKTRWPSWGASSYQGSPVTMATVVQMYNEATQKSEDPTLLCKSKKLSDWERRFVMVDLAESSEVHDAGVPIYKAHRHTLKAFKEQNSGYIHRRVNPDGTVKEDPMTTVWQASRNVRHFAGYTYQPGQPRFCCRPNAYGDDTQYINNFYFPPHDETLKDYDRIDIFNRLVEHLFPEKAERDWFVQWLARLIQNPSVRSFVTPINITPITGTGRGILFDILRLVVGGHNTHDVSKDDIDGKFNGFMDKCLIAVVQEIKAATGDRKFQMWERMKSILADTVVNIRAMRQDSYTAHVYANFLMFSNNIDALPIEDVNERRIYAMRGANRPLTNDEIEDLMDWKNDETNISILFNYLRSRKVDNALFKRAPKSATKVQMVNACVGIGGADLDAWLKEEAPEVFDFDHALEALEKFSEDISILGLSRERFRRILMDKGYHSSQVRLKGARTYVYYHPGRTKGDTETLKKLHNLKDEDLLS